IEYLYVISFVHASLMLVFNVANRAYLPSLVNRDQLLEGNSKVELSRSAAEIAGPGAAGVLVQAVTAPFAVLAQSVALLFSALSLSTIRSPETKLETRERQRIWRDISDGLR